MKNFNVKNNMGIVVSEGFKGAIESAVLFTDKERNAFGGTRYDKSFLGTIVTFNPNNEKVEYFSVYDYVNYDNKSDVDSSIQDKINSIKHSDDYSNNELITVIKASDFEYYGHTGYPSREELESRNIKLDNKFMSLYIDIISRANDKYIVDLNFSIRTTNCLLRAGIETVQQVKAMSLDEISRVRNLGRNSLTEIEERLNIKFV